MKTVFQRSLENKLCISAASVPSVVFLSGPPGLMLEGADQGVAMATGLTVPTVRDQEGMTDGASLMAQVQEGERFPFSHRFLFSLNNDSAFLSPSFLPQPGLFRLWLMPVAVTLSLCPTTL